MAVTETLKTEKLTATVGAEVLDVDLDRVRNDEALPQSVMAALEDNGVLVFRELHLDDEVQSAFCLKLGEVRRWPDRPIPEIYEVSYNPENPYAKYVEGTVQWHIDGTIDQDLPVKATVLTARVLADKGGETEFASTYAAYDALTDEEKAQFATLRVRHSLVAARRLLHPNPTPEQLADWTARGSNEHPLVWTHGTGRKSLVIGASTDCVVGMDPEQSRALLDDLLERATTSDRVFQHSWSVGDMVIWDNCGVVHRAVPYDPDSRREMHRCTIIGTEPIR
jgi:alpha-ketoglutarate-dependent taurine dioxygenase